MCTRTDQYNGHGDIHDAGCAHDGHETGGKLLDIVDSIEAAQHKIEMAAMDCKPVSLQVPSPLSVYNLSVAHLLRHKQCRKTANPLEHAQSVLFSHCSD